MRSNSLDLKVNLSGGPKGCTWLQREYGSAPPPSNLNEKYLWGGGANLFLIPRLGFDFLNHAFLLHLIIQNLSPTVPPSNKILPLVRAQMLIYKLFHVSLVCGRSCFKTLQCISKNICNVYRYTKLFVNFE